MPEPIEGTHSEWVIDGHVLDIWPGPAWTGPLPDVYPGRYQPYVD